MNRDKNDIQIFKEKIKTGVPFRFVRFSDGETEILQQRALKISNGFVNFREKNFKYDYEKFDEKNFDPLRDEDLSNDLRDSLQHKGKSYFKGIPGTHNGRLERDYYLDLIAFDDDITFCDIFHNNNYWFFVKKFIPEVLKRDNVFCVANENAKDLGLFSGVIEIPTNAFPRYNEVSAYIYKYLLALPYNAVVLSSASSFSNIFGFWLDKERPDITFIDVGSGINYLLGLKRVSRVYQVGVFGPRSLNDIKMFAKHAILGKGTLEW